MAAPNQPGKKPAANGPGGAPPARPNGGQAQPNPANGKPAPAANAAPKAANGKPAPRPVQNQLSASASAPARKGPPPPSPKPADQPRGAAVDEPRIGWFRRLLRLGVLALVLILVALVARALIADWPPDFSSEEGAVRFVRAMFQGAREFKGRSRELVGHLKVEMGGVENWLKEHKTELPKTDELMDKALPQS